MGTRGALTFVVDGTEKTAYNHFDSYPTGLGADVLDWLRDLVEHGGLDDAQEQARKLATVPERGPTDEERARLAEFRDDRVGGPLMDPRDEWYKLLRETQGDPEKILRAGLYEDASEFPADSLYCEWAYVVDFDERTFDVYQGFQDRPHANGRFFDRDTPAYSSGIGPYYPVKRIKSWSFDKLPETEALSKFED